MKNILFFFVTLLFFASGTANAQPKAVSDFLNANIKPAKKIILIENDVDADLKNAGKYAEDAMRKYWTATNVEFETKKYSEVKNSKEDALYFGAFKLNDGRTLHRAGKDEDKFYFYSVGFAGRNKNGELSANLEYPSNYLNTTYTETDVIAAVGIINQYVAAILSNKFPWDMRMSTGITPTYYRLSEENKGTLVKKVLLIPQERINKKLDEATIKENYPFKYKIVSKEELAQLVASGDPQYAFFQSVPTYYSETGGLISTAIVVDVQTAELLSFSRVTDVTMVTRLCNPPFFLLSKASLKEVVKNNDK